MSQVHEWVERVHPNWPGVQLIIYFDNGYGVSAIRAKGSYGYEDGFWEIAIVKKIGYGMWDFELTYDTPLTDDVIGKLAWQEVESYANLVKELPNADQA